MEAQLKEELMAKYRALPLSWGQNCWQATVLIGLDGCDGLTEAINSIPLDNCNGWARGEIRNEEKLQVL